MKHWNLKLWLILLTIIGLVISAYFLQSFLGQRGFDYRLVVNQKIMVLIILAVAVQMSAHWVRAKKSQLLFSTIKENKTSVQFEGMSVGYLFNLILPFRLGEFFRAYYLGNKLSISKSVAFLAVVIERVFDAFVVTSIALLAGYLLWGHNLYNSVYFYLALAILLGSLVIGFLVYVVYRQDDILLKTIYFSTSIFNNKIKDKIRLMSWSVIFGAHTILKKLKYSKYILLSFIMWFLYVTSVAILLLPLGLSQIQSVVLSIGSYLSVSFPSGPGYIGTYQYYFSQIMMEVINNPQYILFYSLLTWLVLMIPISVIGIFVLVFNRREEPKAEGKAYDHMLYKLNREKDISSEFSNFLETFFSCNEVSKIINIHEISSKYKLVKSFRGGSNASTLLVWSNKKLYVKKITLPQYAGKLREQFLWLKERESLKNIPRVLNEENGEDYYSFDIEYSPDFETFFDYIHSENISKSKDIVNDLINFTYKEIYVLGEKKKSVADINEYIDKKCISKIEDTANLSTTINQLLPFKKIEVNGEVYDNFRQIIEKIRRNKKIMNSLAEFYSTPIHGDLTVDNIIVNRKTSEFLVLDPNNENQIEDPIVDFGKMYQSLHSGYEFLVQLKEAQCDNNRIFFEENISSKYSDLFRYLEQSVAKKLSEADQRKIIFHEAVHYCRMLTYRAKINPKTVCAFYGVAVKLFNDFYKLYEK